MILNTRSLRTSTIKDQNCMFNSIIRGKKSLWEIVVVMLRVVRNLISYCRLTDKPLTVDRKWLRFSDVIHSHCCIVLLQIRDVILSHCISVILPFAKSSETSVFFSKPVSPRPLTRIKTNVWWSFFFFWSNEMTTPMWLVSIPPISHVRWHDYWNIPSHCRHFVACSFVCLWFQVKHHEKDKSLFGRAGVSMIDWPEPDFSAARALHREGLMRFSQERSIIAALNDRLAVLIDMVRLGEVAFCEWVQNN